MCVLMGVWFGVEAWVLYVSAQVLLLFFSPSLKQY